MLNNEEKKVTVSRRKFLKASTAVGVGTAIASVSTVCNPKKEGTAYAKTLLTKEHDEFPLEIASDYQRFHQKNTGFLRGYDVTDPGTGTSYMDLFKAKGGVIQRSGKPGWTDLDYAISAAAWSIEIDYGEGSVSGIGTGKGIYAWEGPIHHTKTMFSSPKEASKIIKKTSKYLGADLVGIAKYEDVEKWVYSHWYNPLEKTSIPAEFPFRPKSVISFAFEMDYAGYQTAPSSIADAATGHEYSRMATTAHKMAVFLRQIGYQAIPAGNEIAMSIPIAIQSGLGELGRMGLLITEEYGGRVRLAKVFTNLELEQDKPITFGVKEFCKTCMKCADNCPSKAIIKDIEPSFKLHNRSNLPGIKKWNINAENCLHFWGENGASCAICISVCPYNKIEEWHHYLSRLATVIPGVKDVAREFDELFGYGIPFNNKAIEEYWDKLDY